MSKDTPEGQTQCDMAADWEKFKALGGSVWVRAKIKAAKVMP